MKKIIIITFFVIVMLFTSCYPRQVEVEKEFAEVVLRDELQSLYTEIIITHDYYDVNTDFSATLLYKAYGIYSVDLSDALVSVFDNIVRISLPKAKLAHFGIKDEEFGIYSIENDRSIAGRFKSGGEEYGLQLADEERALVENEARELLQNEYFLNKANDMAIDNVRILVESVNSQIENLQVVIDIQDGEQE